MSYILDALKRADAERERGRVPGLHAQSAAPASGAGEPQRAMPPIAWLAGGVVVLGAVAALAWRLGADTQPPVTPAPPAAALPQEMSVPAPAPYPQATPQATPQPPVTATAPPAAQAPVVLPGPLVPARPAAGDEPPVAAAPTPAATPGPARGPATPTRAAQPPAPATARVPTLAELPAATRRELPALSVGGSVYSDDPAARFFLLNGEVAKEGAQPLPGLVVERIEPRGAVLRYRDQRFRLPF